MIYARATEVEEALLLKDELNLRQTIDALGRGCWLEWILEDYTGKPGLVNPAHIIYLWETP